MSFFSSDLRHFQNLIPTTEGHRWGRLEMFNGKLLAIAGEETRNVELKQKNGKWRNITPVGNRNGSLFWFSSLTIPGNPSDTLFVFGIHILTILILTISIRRKVRRRICTYRWGLAIRQQAVEQSRFTPQTFSRTSDCTYWWQHISHWWKHCGHWFWYTKL